MPRKAVQSGRVTRPAGPRSVPLSQVAGLPLSRGRKAFEEDEEEEADDDLEEDFDDEEAEDLDDEDFDDLDDDDDLFDEDDLDDDE